jgi:hypothetical protein
VGAVVTLRPGRRVIGPSASRTAPEVMLARTRSRTRRPGQPSKRTARARSIPNIAKFATAVVQLHQDSSVARDAIAAFEAATANEQRACLTFILFKDCRP